ncbi:hypothetical protein CLAFUW4_05589 [Fulvia fulva]|uniref:Yeast cell wall synthesis Kre9/Knh1-like N-terminal domain-containing protein n=1 Tax=Passalora fulva TaxID=5499 RepID=A0A9Q8LHW5_PASFU|nr:uncharacterized protein CLAFUR5_05731 [Fulvia fulva]KAK4624022.1 hypothetical protein CLAFUR4_05583 [Fulvia fulva]KAK4625819.1 hypothetical protein CLAFUR0_05592 [Fulvia fulva]UJO17946.1 hypothetical protein CLAFUR5_05731 [Fulvia fulva]WPV14471.1 hypothetical protein CLAFUW4_05589 [Fulvia fulva]WPV29388.1 hypothetical protein CLAFUW7_05587 [Fulvia fulva]
MQSFTKRCALALATLATAVTALDGIVAPSEVAAGEEFEVTFQSSNDDSYRVYLAASLAGSNGPTCYLVNSTELDDSINVTIPASVGPTANYYSIAIADITTGQAATFSNRFNLTGATGEYSDYEDHLGGSPFWSADDLPCTAYNCARQCAQDGYPKDLTEDDAYNTMKTCIMSCKGVTAAVSQTAPAHASSTSGPTATLTGMMAVITMSGGSVVTAIEIEQEVHGSTITQAIIGDATITLNGAAHTIGSAQLSLATDGVAVGDSTTVMFSSTTATMGGATATDSAASASTSDGAASKNFMAGAAGAAAAGFAGLAFVL